MVSATPNSIPNGDQNENQDGNQNGNQTSTPSTSPNQLVQTSTTTTTTKKPLPNRYEIRELTLQDSIYAAAIHFHANTFHSPKWSAEYAGHRTAACLKAFQHGSHLYDEPILRGGQLCWGIFDTEFTPQNPTGQPGVFWSEFGDGTDISDDEGEKLLLEKMDFGLVSICVSHDDFLPPSEATLGLFVRAMPEAIQLYAIMDPIRKAQLAANKEFVPTTGLGQRLKRAGTATKADYQGRGLMRMLATWCVERAREQGWRSLLINTSAGAVSKVWLSLGGKIVCRVNVRDYEDENGVKIFERSGSEVSVMIEVVF